MNLEFWLENWKNNRIGFHQAKINNHLTAFWQQLELISDARVFVPLCGKSLDLLWLNQLGHQVFGVEISELAVDSFFSENGITYTRSKLDDFQLYQAEALAILQGDFFNVTAEHLRNVEGVYDRASLVAMPFELRRKYSQHLKSTLPDTAKILLVTFEYEQSLMQGPPFSVSETEVQSSYQDAYEIHRLLVHDVLDSYPQFKSAGLDHFQEKVYLLKPHKRPER